MLARRSAPGGELLSTASKRPSAGIAHRAGDASSIRVVARLDRIRRERRGRLGPSYRRPAVEIASPERLLRQVSPCFVHVRRSLADYPCGLVARTMDLVHGVRSKPARRLSAHQRREALQRMDAGESQFCENFYAPVAEGGIEKLLMEGPMRPLIIIAATVLVIAIGYMVKTAMFPSATVYSLAGTTAPATLSPHEIHLNYKAIKDLPVHDSTNAH